MNKKQIPILILAVLLVVAAGITLFGGPSSDKEGTNNQTNKMENNTQDSGKVQGTTDGEETANADIPADCARTFNEDTLKNAKVEITNRTVELDVKGYGKIQVQLYDKDAPKTVENFLRLVNSGFYDCLTFHRIAKGFVIQGGDPKGDGTGGISAFGPEFEDELNPNTESYKAGYKHGVLAMANRGENTNTSQFFILLSDYPLDHKYTIFGKVSTGLDVVDKIGGAEIVPNPFMGPTDGAPKEPIVITKASIIK